MIVNSDSELFFSLFGKNIPQRKEIIGRKWGGEAFYYTILCTFQIFSNFQDRKKIVQTGKR